MDKLKVNDACPNCWHGAKVSGGGIGTYCIYPIIAHTGGTLDKTKTCHICNWNFNSVKKCISCRSYKPCSTHHAVAFNGKYNAHMSALMQQLYMRNSPYRRLWNERPRQVGSWYAKQVSNYTEAIHMAKRFLNPDDIDRCTTLNRFEDGLHLCTNLTAYFWSGFYHICREYFSGADVVSCAMAGFYSTLRANHLFLALFYYE